MYYWLSFYSRGKGVVNMNIDLMIAELRKKPTAKIAELLDISLMEAVGFKKGKDVRVPLYTALSLADSFLKDE